MKNPNILRVIQVDDESYYVESSEGKICYRVIFEGDSATCTCGDYSRGIKSDPNFKCKHIISVYNCIPAGEVQHGQLLERAKPKLNDRFIIKIENRDFVQYAGLLDLGTPEGYLTDRSGPDSASDRGQRELRHMQGDGHFKDRGLLHGHRGCQPQQLQLKGLKAHPAPCQHQGNCPGIKELHQHRDDLPGGACRFERHGRE